MLFPTRLVARSSLGMLAAAIIATTLLPSPASWADDDPGAPTDTLAWSVVPANPEGPDGRSAFDFTVAAGSTITDWVTVRNHSGHGGIFRVYASDAVTDYDSAKITLIPSSQSPTDLGAWASIDSAPAFCPDPADTACIDGIGTVIELGPGQSATLPVTIQVPADATPGDHVAGIVASHLSTDVDEGAARVLREDRVGMRVYLRVEGELAPAVEITGLSTSYASGWNPVAGGTATVGFELHNAGNARINAAPAVTITGPFGLPLGTQTLEPVTELLPGGTGYVSTAFTGVPPLLLLWGDVEIVAQSPSAETPLSDRSEGITWAIPWTLLALLAIIASAIVIWRWARKRRRADLAEDLAEYTRSAIQRDRQARESNTSSASSATRTPQPVNAVPATGAAAPPPTTPTPSTTRQA